MDSLTIRTICGFRPYLFFFVNVLYWIMLSNDPFLIKLIKSFCVAWYSSLRLGSATRTNYSIMKASTWRTKCSRSATSHVSPLLIPHKSTSIVPIPRLFLLFYSCYFLIVLEGSFLFLTITLIFLSFCLYRLGLSRLDGHHCESPAQTDQGNGQEQSWVQLEDLGARWAI